MVSNDAVLRCIGALEILSEEARGLPLIEIAKRLSIPPSTAHRILLALVKAGIVKQDQPSQYYLLTFRLTILGFRFLAQTNVINLCQPVLDRLAAQTGELVEMSMVEGEEISWIAKAQGSRTGLRFDPPMGGRVQVSTMASGRVWLADKPTDFAVRVLLRQGFGDRAELGPNAISTIEEFLAALERTRQWGYGLSIDEAEPGMSAIALPIHRSPNSATAGTISVAGPTARLTRERLIGFLPAMRAAVQDLSILWSVAGIGNDPSLPSRERVGAQSEEMRAQDSAGLAL